MRPTLGSLVAGIFTGLLLTPGSAAAEPFVDMYIGKSFTLGSDVRIRQPALGNDFTLHDVSYDDQSFTDPPWYGLRAGYFFEKYPWLGVSLEFFHFKMIADTAEQRRVTGTRSGAPIDATTRVDSLVQQFQVTHGVNYLTLDALFRYSLLKDRERFRHGRVQLYGGFGAGPVITHAENRIDQVKNDEKSEVAGAGVQAFVGARALLFKYFGVFAEYKFTHAGLKVGVASGDGRVSENTHHLVWGITVPLPSF